MCQTLFIKGVDTVGKDLKGKELGSGICQRKDGKYSARFTSVAKKRVEQHFDTITEARKWLAEAKYEDEHCNIGASSQMTVNSWYEYWITNIKEKTTRYNTARSYRERYEHNIRDVIGSMIISEVKPMHCQQVLNLMQEKYKGSTIEQCRITMASMFYYAYENQIISSSPVIKSVKSPKPAEKKIRFLTLEEQRKFLEVAKGTSNYYQFLFILNTGLRAGELAGLRWCDVDFKNRTISINQTLEFRYGYKEFKVGEPKSKSGYRTIPLTDTAYNILKIKKKNSKKERYAVCNLRIMYS